MKKVRTLLCLLLSVLLLSSCGGEAAVTPPEESSGPENINLTLWTFPIGNWGNPTAVTNILSGFHKKYPNIYVSVEYLNYETGDERIRQAVSLGTPPDLVLEGPERIVANWGEHGWMLDLSDLWESRQAGKIYGPIRTACWHRRGVYYEYPICMTAHCMAINYDMFREADALRYINEETRTWTTEGFIRAVEALTANGQKAGVVYCKNQGGDQGTRALVNNLYNGTFTNKTHTDYTVDSEENRKALQLLYDLEGITFEPEFSSADAIKEFCEKKTAMCFCWNAAIEVQQTLNGSGMDFEVFPMAFPSDDGLPKLQGGIWGFGIFNKGSKVRANAAKTFIRYIAENDAAYVRAVRTTSYWPVRDMGDIYENDMLMTEYSVFTPYVGDYYQITPGWTQARTAWWQMLSEIGAGADIAEAVKDFPAVD